MLFLSSVKYLKAQRLKWRASRHHSPSCSVIKEETRPFSQENHCMPLKEHLYWRKTRQLCKGVEEKKKKRRRNLVQDREANTSSLQQKTDSCKSRCIKKASPACSCLVSLKHCLSNIHLFPKRYESLLKSLSAALRLQGPQDECIYPDLSLLRL